MIDYIIDNNNVIYDSDTFYVLRDVKVEKITSELLDKQKGFQHHYVLIKNNVSNETNGYNQQLNDKLSQYTLESKGRYYYNPSIHKNEYYTSRYVLNNLIYLQNSSHVLLLNNFKPIDGYFESSDFQQSFFKSFIKKDAEVSFDYHKLIGQTKIKSFLNAIKMKLRFNKQIATPNVNTHIIIKDTKSSKTKEYKYISLAKLERILTKHTLIQPTITLKLIYFNIDTEIDENQKEHIKIKYWVSINVSELIVFTNNFDKTIFFDLGDYYDNNSLMIMANNKILINIIIFYIIMFIGIMIKNDFK